MLGMSVLAPVADSFVTSDDSFSMRSASCSEIKLSAVSIFVCPSSIFTGCSLLSIFTQSSLSELLFLAAKFYHFSPVLSMVHRY